MSRAQRAAGEVRFRRLIQPRRRRRRLPRQVFPRGISSDYQRAFKRLANHAFQSLDPLLAELPRLLAANAREKRADAGEARRIADLIEQAENAARSATDRRAVEGLARRYAGLVSNANRKQLQRQTRAALGVDMPFRDSVLLEVFEAFAAENAMLIRDLPTKVIREVSQSVQRAVATGQLHKDLAGILSERVMIGERRAGLIARDQIGKLYGQINATRQKQLGVTEFIWRTSGDERVREEHQSLNGRRFKYNEPPSEGLPGEAVLCRCYAEPVFDPILGEL